MIMIVLIGKFCNKCQIFFETIYISKASRWLSSNAPLWRCNLTDCDVIKDSSFNIADARITKLESKNGNQEQKECYVQLHEAIYLLHSWREGFAPNRRRKTRFCARQRELPDFYRHGYQAKDWLSLPMSKVSRLH